MRRGEGARTHLASTFGVGRGPKVTSTAMSLSASGRCCAHRTNCHALPEFT
ncbi:hypothetical protein BHM03_00008397 [Ensete ventricosum]|nr:hypothetical protein BHM03_00008397 [Ensete ventricosum]